MAFVGKSSFPARGNSAFPAPCFYSGAPHTARSGTRRRFPLAIDLLPQFPQSVPGLSHKTTQNLPLGMRERPLRSSKRGEKRGKTPKKCYNSSIQPHHLLPQRGWAQSQSWHGAGAPSPTLSSPVWDFSEALGPSASLPNLTPARAISNPLFPPGLRKD